MTVQKGINMINITNFKFNFQQISNAETALLTEVRPLFKYVNGKITDEQEGNKYELVLPANRYEKITVKVIEKNPSITSEEIVLKGGSVKVKPKNFEGKFYRVSSSGEYAFTSTASNIEVVA